MPLPRSGASRLDSLSKILKYVSASWSAPRSRSMEGHKVSSRVGRPGSLDAERAFWRDNGREALARAMRRLNMGGVQCGCNACYSHGRCDEGDHEPHIETCTFEEAFVSEARKHGVLVSVWAEGDWVRDSACRVVEEAEEAVQKRLGGREFQDSACVDSVSHLYKRASGEYSFGSFARGREGRVALGALIGSIVEK